MVKSLLRFSWATSLYGMQQAGNLLRALRQDRLPYEVIASLSALTAAAEARLAWGGFSVRSAGQEGQPWDGLVLDLPLAIGTASTSPLKKGGRQLLRGTLALLQESTETLRLMTHEPELQIACQELKSKLEAFEYFQYAYAILDLEADALTLTERVARVPRLDPYHGNWVLEGLGYGHAEAAFENSEHPSGLLTDRELDALPRPCWLPLHTGMGLLLARRTLTAGDPHALAQDSGPALTRFAELCALNCRPGYELAAFEALGLVARNLHPHAVPEIARRLTEFPFPQRATFLHGVGRGLYFNLTQSLPGASAMWQGILKIRREIPDQVGQLNALSGLAWALTLINIRHPQVLAVFLRHHAEQLHPAERDAFANGIGSSLAIWYNAVGRDLLLQDLLTHPVAADPGLERAWHEFVTDPAEAALSRYPQLLAGDGLGQLFHFQAN